MRCAAMSGVELLRASTWVAIAITWAALIFTWREQGRTRRLLDRLQAKDRPPKGWPPVRGESPRPMQLRDYRWPGDVVEHTGRGRDDA